MTVLKRCSAQHQHSHARRSNTVLGEQKTDYKKNRKKRKKNSKEKQHEQRARGGQNVSNQNWKAVHLYTHKVTKRSEMCLKAYTKQNATFCRGYYSEVRTNGERTQRTQN